MVYNNAPVLLPDRAGAANQLEDKVFKTAAMFFGNDLLPYLGIKGKMTAIAPTEQVHLEARRMEEDFNFKMEDGTLRHLEFESDRINERDLRRFREYEAFLSLIHDGPVITTVLCSADIKRPKTMLKCGINVYRIELVCMKDRNADDVFDGLEKALGRGQLLTRSDIFPILLTPLMSGTMDMCRRISGGIDLLHSEQVDMNQDDLRHMEAVLYALAVKFLDKAELAKVKEKMSMTLLGQMLMEDGIEKGIEKGIEQGIKKGIERGEMIKLISQVIKKAGKGMLPNGIAEVLEENPAVINRIYSAVREHPDLDENAIYELLYRQP